MPRTLFTIKQRVILTLNNGGGSTYNMPYNSFSSDFVLYRATDTNLEFLVKDLDRKPIASQGKQYRIAIIRFDTNELVYRGYGQVVEPYRGLVVFEISPEVTAIWEDGFFRYSVTMVNEDGREFPLFVDQDHSAIGFLELRSNNIPKPAPIITVMPSDFIRLYVNNQQIPTTEYFQSQSVPGTGAYSDYKRNVSIAVYATNFIGTFRIEATLDEVPEQDDANWFRIDLDGTDSDIVYDNFSGIDVYSIEGNYTWFRVIYKPTLSNTGSFDKVLIKI